MHNQKEKKHCVCDAFFLIAKVGKRGSIRVKSQSQPKSTSRAPTKCTYVISASLLNLEGSYARNKLKNWENPTKNPLFLSCEGMKWGWKI